MPRGIPNVKRDDTGLKYTTFNVPLGLNPKHVGSTYLKTDSQLLWHRNAMRKKEQTEETAPAQDQQRRGSQIIVIHPGSRSMRIGRASDVKPASIPNVIARKTRSPPARPVFSENITRPRNKQPFQQSNDEVKSPSTDPFEETLAQISQSLRDRMSFYKFRVTPNAGRIASTFNEAFQPEIIAEHNDPYRVEWIDGTSTAEILVGEMALRIGDPCEAQYIQRWPIYGNNFNTHDYPSFQLVLNDLEAIIRITLEENFGIQPSDYKNLSVVLVIPDFYDRAYVHHWANIILVSMGFKQMCAQQESLAATFGAGITNACVVDIGAKVTSIACVDEGLVIADTRMSLNIGGDDITEFFHVLLERISFPYRGLDLARSYDWYVVQDLKTRLCTLLESDVALNLYDFVVRQPGKPAEKYGLRAYDEVILAPMCIFEPKVIEFDRKRARQSIWSPSSVTEEIMELPGDHVTGAMVISTQHLMPRDSPSETHEKAEPGKEGAVLATSKAGPSDIGSDVPMEGVENEDPSQALQNPSSKSQSAASPEPSSGRDFHIDVCFEASKLPLDVAIFNCARAAGEEKIRKYLQAVLVIGGTALIPGMGHALESRLQAIATPLISNMEKVQVIPPPKDVDPQVLAWKGAAVLGKMDAASELWVTRADWDLLGMRALKERCFFL